MCGQPALSLVLALNRNTATAGDLVDVSVSVDNPGGPLAVDVYFAIVLPEEAASGVGCAGSLALAFVANGGADFALLCSSDPPQTYPPYAANVTVPGGLNATVPGILSLIWPPGTPEAFYTFAIFATPLGALADGAFGEGDVLSVGADELAVTP